MITFHVSRASRRRPIAAACTLLTATLLLGALPAHAQVNRDPERARFVTDDITHFWAAFDARGALGTAAAMDSLYFAPATAGLQDFRRLRLQDPAIFARTVDAASRYYASTRESTLRIAGFEPQLRQVLRTLAAQLPDAVFPDVYFVMWRLSTGGTTGPAGLLIGAEMYGRTADSLLGKPLNDWHRAVLRRVDDLPGIVSHELVHYQQRPDGPTLLEKALREGIADFVGERISGMNINAPAVAWATSHEAELWAEFQGAMLGTDYSRWLFNGSSSIDRPADLGYVMGYRIAQAWFARHGGERGALRRMLNVEGLASAQRFLAESGYAPGGGPRPP
ncbi:MAG: hypothetical protein K2R93_15955 [Gemmatimonadaceae bacterium]|nr:hypothetical protein [Gemmatimonadaceae bacterium]